MITRNSFSSGMNKDGSKTKLNQSSYNDALNVRLVTDTGKSSGVLMNVRGNELMFTIPDVGNYIKVVGSGSSSFPSSVLFDITNTDTSGVSTTVSFNWTPTGAADDPDSWEDLAAFINADTTIQSLGLNIVASGLSLLMYSPTYATVTFTPVTVYLSSITIASAQTNLQVIGYTNIRDTLVLLTTSSSNTSYNSTNIGQIWSFTYDKVTLQTSPTTAGTLTLLYNNVLGFSLEYPICSPGNILGNYENSTTQKIYWCDYKNPIRNFNIADPDGFYKDPAELKSSADVIFDIPQLIDIIQTSGNLDVAMYQFTYKLTNVNGASTSYSPPSQLLHIVPPHEDSSNIINYNYFNSASTAAKSIKMRIDNVDTRYDRIQVAAIKWKVQTNTSSSPDEIYTFLDEPIPTNGIFEFIHTGNETKSTVTKEEFITNNFNPDICKTMATKDNMLLIGNVKLHSLDLGFDCRAFRYPKQYTTTNQTSTGAYIPTYTIGDLPDTQNDINNNQDPTSWNNNLYQYNSVTLGGTGANISYKFITELTYLDQLNIGGSSVPPVFEPPYLAGSFVTLNDKTYSNINFWRNPASPSVIGTLRSYQRNEVYRFAIVFYDLNGNPGWANWIGDIRFPDFYMPDTTSANNTDRTLQYPLTTVSFPHTYGNALGIEFTVNNLNLIADRVSGYSIVRVQRKMEDRTMLTQGIVHIPHWDSGTGTHYATHGIDLAGGVNTDYYDDPSLIHAAANKDFSDQFGIFYGPDTQFTDFRITLDNTELLEITGVLDDSQERNMYDGGGAAVTDTTIQKCAGDLDPVPVIAPTSATAITKKFRVIDNYFADRYQNTNSYSVGGVGFNNHDISKRTQGGRHLALQLDKDGTNVGSTAAWKNVAYSGGSKYYDGDGLKETDKVYSARLTKTNVNQYGGNTLTDRSENEYILCNHYQRVLTNTITLSSKVYGGDVWVNLYDNVTEFKAWQVPAASGTKSAWAYIFPTESYINVALRLGEQTINRNFIDNNGGNSDQLDMKEDYLYMPIFSIEEVVKPYIPKPIPFTEIDTFDTRVYYSDTKIQGETGDSWTVFKTANYRDVESTYGPINNLSILSNKLFFWQDRSFGTIPINRRILQVDANSGTEMQLGEGVTMDKHEYISTKVGSKHQWSILTTDKSFYWFDILSNKQIRFSQNGIELLSDVHGLHSQFENNINGSIITNDNPILSKGISTVYDYTYNEAIFTFHDIINSTNQKFTLAYSDQTDSYTTFYSFQPGIYITDKYIIMSPDPNNISSLYVHDYGQYGKFYGNYYDSYVRFLTNEYPDNTKVFTNLEIQSEVLINDVDTSNSLFPVQETVNKIRCFNDYQDTGLLTLTVGTNIKRRFRTWRTEIPRNQLPAQSMSFGFYPRLRDKYNYVELYFTNNSNKKLVLHDCTTMYMLTPY